MIESILNLYYSTVPNRNHMRLAQKENKKQIILVLLTYVSYHSLAFLVLLAKNSTLRPGSTQSIIVEDWKNSTRILVYSETYRKFLKIRALKNKGVHVLDRLYVQSFI